MRLVPDTKINHTHPMKIAVTAASGRLGHAILGALLDATDPARNQLVAVARDPARVNIAGIETRSGDYRSTAQMTAAFAGIDTVVMISAPVAGGGDRLQLHNDVIAAAVQARVRKIIYTSVISNGAEAGTLFEDFARINLATETAIRASGLEWIIGRNGLYLDLDVVQIRAAASAGGVYRNSGGTGRCGYIAIAELAYAYAQLATSERCNGQCLNLIGATGTQAELVRTVKRVFQLEVRCVPLSHVENLARLRSIEMLASRGEDVINMLAGCFQCIAAGVFDVGSEYEIAAGRGVRSLEEQMGDL
jgi:NAD(P)H dehydrogenase (quinone)